MTNRMDNMTTDERHEAARPLRRNYITEQCCSVQDLQSYLRSWKPVQNFAVNKAIDDLQNSIDYEIKHQNRVSIIKLLKAKRNAFQKQVK